MPETPIAPEALAALHTSLERHASVLPPMPGILLKLQEELGREFADARKLANLVRTDPGLAGPILRLANSIYYRGAQDIVEVENAIQRIGFESLRTVATSISLRNATRTPTAGLSLPDFWRHSLLVAVVSVKLARTRNYNRAQLEQIWMAALLHDIGILVAPLLWPEKWQVLLEKCALDPEENPKDFFPRDLLTLELTTFGMHHARLGEIFLHRQWKLPDSICLLAGRWPQPELIDPPEWAEIIASANRAAQKLGVCWQPPTTRVRPENECVETIDDPISASEMDTMTDADLSEAEDESESEAPSQPPTEPDPVVELARESLAMVDIMLGSDSPSHC